jgi:hypothetical protein
MPINRLLKDSKLEPEHIAVLNRAFDLALSSLGLVDRNDPVCDIVAIDIIQYGTDRIRDPVEIANAVTDRYK